MKLQSPIIKDWRLQKIAKDTVQALAIWVKEHRLQNNPCWKIDPNIDKHKE